ncbi:hypothetical protein PHISCL_00045 [Aspergillus sclerotialis]|uniref:Xylanolytic transcriptional activator regulatory domain-containing protein n=1 Tax=Aspergillus sclerotialis TaxID=2070753 RepID=A0A3A2ZY10_9EURO|nr:hypothetical protein PHISCL_00045 [Aspergillus sclerotialis]
MEWRLNKLVRLPRSLDSCSQTISTKPIKITHALVITAEFQGSNGQILAKVNENIPFRVYMTPDTIGEDAVVYGQDIQSLQERGSPPPPYGNHKRCFHNRSDFPEPSTPAGFHSPIPEAGEKSVGSGIQGSILPSPGASDRQNQNTLSPLEAEQQQVALQNALDTSTARERSPVKEPEAHRFVCDSNPVAAFLDDRQSRLRKGQDRRGDVGTWVHDDRVTSESDGQQNQFPIHALLPPKQNQMKLVDIYFRRIHPVLPLVDEDATLSQFTSGTLSIPLLQSICLVASKDRNAAPLLYLGSGRALLPLEKFSHLIYKNILENIPRREERQRITTIQILALLSLHEWGPYGSEDSSSCLARAIHHAQTIGLHLRKPDREPGSSLDALFWCLWCLDRWNAAIHGRPVIIHGRDIGQEVADVVPSFKPPFRISLPLARQLSQVIDCYRPIVDKSFNQDIELSTFEEIIENSNSWGTNPELLGK